MVEHSRTAEGTNWSRSVAPDYDPLYPPEPGLELAMTVKVVRVKRRRCPRCGNVRILFRLTAFGQSPIGDGPLLCGRCGGLR